MEHFPLAQQALKGELVTVSDTTSDLKKMQASLHTPETADSASDHHSLLCAPLIHKDKTLGTIHVYSTKSKHFSGEKINHILPLTALGAAALTAVRELKTLENLSENQVKFINIATHELRSPITVSQSLVRSVLKGYAGNVTKKQEDVFGRISKSLDSLENLVNDLLDMAASRASDLPNKKEPVSLKASIGRAVLLLQPRAEEKNVALTYRTHPKELIVLGSEEGLDRVFINLVGNAVKYTSPGGSVAVTVKDKGEEIQIEISDTGMGIPQEAIPHLFNEFYRAPNAKKSEEIGTGLGLIVVKDLVQAYGGNIKVKSKVGEGTTFTVTLPVAGDW